jgi:hypothetical protein
VGAQHIAQFLRTKNNLTALGLAWNSISMAGTDLDTKYHTYRYS